MHTSCVVHALNKCHGRAVVLVCRAGLETEKHADTQEEKHMYTHINMDVCIATFSYACDRHRQLQTKSLHLCQENKCRLHMHAFSKCLGRAVVLVCRAGMETEKHADTQPEKEEHSCLVRMRQERRYRCPSTSSLSQLTSSSQCCETVC
jgi:hypothetical protein